MGKRGGKRGSGGGRGRGGARGNGRPPRDDRVNKQTIPRTNEKFERYYNELVVVSEEEKEAFWSALRRDLPNSFRFTGSKSHALAVQERLRNFYIPEITSIEYEGSFVDAPQPVSWYPDQLAWFMTTPKHVIRRFKPFASFQKFLVAEADVGNITRQEVVSMIPPLVIDLKPGMTVLDLCAAPGSKSAQLLEMLHSGEEDRAREVASRTADGQDRPRGEEYIDDGRSTGLLIANDVDYKRAHMLVHQMKRLASPNIIVTNHDATIFPSIKISSEVFPDGKTGPNRYLKFDRILADVPCSGDGTPRKNIEIWKSWSPSNALGLHITQVRILVRALQMLKVGGRVVYSTCSMNPVEDEAVLAAAIERCGGSDLIDIVETKDLLPGLKRSPGLRQWKIMDKAGRVWGDWASVEKQRQEAGDDGLSRLQEAMFPPRVELPLDRAMRVYPHQQDTGAFFIAILEKKSEIRARPEDKSAIIPKTIPAVAVDLNGAAAKLDIEPNGHIAETHNPPAKSDSLEESNDVNGQKRKRDDAAEEEKEPDAKRAKGIPEITAPALSVTEQLSEAARISTSHTYSSMQVKKKNRDQPFEEPFKYLQPDIPELEQIRSFYDISPRFPSTRFMVRNAQSTATKNIYYTTELAKDILQENEGKGLKFVHSGVKMFVKQDAPAPDVCPWRIQTDGLRILETWVGKGRIIRLHQKETLRKLLIEMFPRFHGEDWKNLGEIGQQVRDVGMGCCVLVVDPTEAEGGFSEQMVFPLWKSIHSLNLMLPKEERKAMLLRLYNDDSALVNMGQTTQMKMEAKAKKVEAPTELRVKDPSGTSGADERRNSSSPEPDNKGESTTRHDAYRDNESDEDVEVGGVDISTE